MSSSRPSRAVKTLPKSYAFDDWSDDDDGPQSYESDTGGSVYGGPDLEDNAEEEDDDMEDENVSEDNASEEENITVDNSGDEQASLNLSLQDVTSEEEDRPAKRSKTAGGPKAAAPKIARSKDLATIEQLHKTGSPFITTTDRLMRASERHPPFDPALFVYKTPLGPKQPSTSKPVSQGRKNTSRKKARDTSSDDDEPEENDGTQEDIGEDSLKNSAMKLDNYVFKLGTDTQGVPLSVPMEIVDDICRLAVKQGLGDFVKKLNGRPLSLGTLCAGSESPVLGLKMMRESLKKFGLEFDVNHKMSAEIVPFKQSYIQLNFAPDVLFRDITEFMNVVDDADGIQRATTAYGAKAVVPGGMDIIVCGFSCVDFSALNCNRKTLKDSGESGDTFSGMLAYLRLHKPKLVVLENVVNAPWSDVKFVKYQKKHLAEAMVKANEASNGNKKGKVSTADREDLLEHIRSSIDDNVLDRGIDWHMYQAGYFALHVVVDTKAFRLPQTRQRGYMLGISIEEFSRQYTKSRDPLVIYQEANRMLSKWAALFTGLGRWATVPVNGMLAASGDDTGPGFSRVEEIDDDKKKKVVPWVKCKAIHAQYRDHNKYGTDHPLTFWTENGAKHLPDHWPPAKGLTERVLDTLDTAHIRNAVRGIDDREYDRYLELSQNVHRVTDTIANGLIGCLTPTGIPWMTSAGRRFTGREAMLLQGLDVSRLELSNLSESNMQNFTGNAMSLPVVTSAIVAAFSVFKAMISGDDSVMKVDRPIVQPASIEACTIEKVSNPTTATQTLAVQDVLRQAMRTASLCSCEGRHQTFAKAFRKCTVCGHAVCLDCSGNPVHRYENISKDVTAQREQPSTFEQKLLDNLPPKLVLRLAPKDKVRSLFNYSQSNDAKAPEGVSWENLCRAYENALNSDVFAEKVHRGANWTVLYRSSAARAVLTIAEKKVEWLVYAQCEEYRGLGDPLRVYLDSHPIARMCPSGENLTSGNWQVWRPDRKEIPAVIVSSGDLKPTYLNTIGVSTEQDVFVFDKCSVQIPAKSRQFLEVDISGEFELSQECARAFNTLHRKSQSPSDGSPVFFFLDHINLGGDHSQHPFVFTQDPSRMQYGQYRQTLATLAEWKQPKIFRRANGGKVVFQVTENGDTVTNIKKASHRQAVKLHVDGSWISSTLSIEALRDSLTNYRQLSSKPSLDISSDCTNPIAVMTCEAMLPPYLADQYPNHEWVKIGPHNQSKVFKQLRWALQQGLIIDGHVSATEVWHTAPAGSNNQICRPCAPKEPAIYWAFKWVGMKTKVRRQEPFERPEEAAEFERCLKNRPNAISCMFKIQNGTIKFHIEVNPASLCHRAVKNLCPDGEISGVSTSWLLSTDDIQGPQNQEYTFNVKDSRDVSVQKSQYRLPAGIQLRPEQRRCVGGLVSQEQQPPLFTEEVIIEESVAKVGYRIWGRASRQVPIKGGFALHPVGFGKTVIMLGLIDAQRKADQAFASRQEKGAIRSKATLILMPHGLTAQWAGEVMKFLGIPTSDKRILVIGQGKRWDSISVQQIIDAEIIIMSWNHLESDKYTHHLAQFAGMVDPDEKLSPRAKSAYYQSTIARVESNVDLLTSNPSGFEKAVHEQFESNVAEAAMNEKPVPSKRVNGAGYVNHAERSNTASGKRKRDVSQEEGKEVKIQCTLVGPQGKKGLKGMKGLPLEAFHFARVIVDEYPYMGDGLGRTLKFLKRQYLWMLSATPDLDSFEAVRSMAAYLRINLGVVDYTSMPGDIFKKAVSEMTGSEKFLIYEKPKSPAWGAHRRQQAQNFLDACARRDMAVIGEIPTTTRYRISHPPATELAGYIELMQVLASNNFDMPRPQHFPGNRHVQVQSMLSNCSSYGQVLLKHPISFNNFVDPDMQILAENFDPKQSSSLALALNSQVRSDQYKDLFATIGSLLQKAVWLSNQAETAAYGQFKAYVEQLTANNFGDTEVCHALLRACEALRDSYDPDDWQMFYCQPAASEAENGNADNSNAKKGKTKNGGVTSPNSSAKLPTYPHGTILAQGKTQVAMVYEFRNVVSKLCSGTEKLVKLKRGARFMNGARLCQQEGTSPASGIACDQCRINKPGPDDVTVLSECGHILCNTLCLPFTEGQCPVVGCHANNASYQKIPGSVFNVAEPRKDYVPAESKKLEDLVLEIQKKPSDKVLLFIQQEAAIEVIRELLTSHGISCVSLANNDQSAKTLAGFQKGQDQSQVLILNIGNSSAAGANLTIANRVFFVAPYYTVGTNGQRKWEAAMEQARGRAVRFGQHRTVEIVHFFTANTFEVDLFEYRSGKILDHGHHDGHALLRDRVAGDQGGPYSSSTSHLVLGGYE